LGVPGLINAYRSAAALALQLAPIIQRPVLIQYRLQFDYTQINDVMKIARRCSCVILKQELQLFCLLELAIPKTRTEIVMDKLKNLGVTAERI